ncbi:MAG TPA: transketolase C-terminal domain-containing protein [Candidatus Binatia bacterium]|nr:transketolase C-terminal domain-containing protein [Candidatus Binatia bacterium]
MSGGPELVTMAAAIHDALAEEMRRDERVVLFGEDIGRAGGVFKVSQGLWEEFGAARVWDTPISEVAITGMALGAALNGMRPVLDLMFSDFFAVAWDQVVNQIAKFRYQTGGQGERLPLVLRAASGAGIAFGAQHSQSIESWFCPTPGLKVVVPSCPRDAKGLVKAAIRDDGPVCVLEPKALYFVKGPAAPPDEVVPLGRAAVVRAGDAATVVACGFMVPRALAAADALGGRGHAVEVIDLRTVIPLDRATIAASLRKTGRLVTVDETPAGAGWAADVLAWALEEGLVRPGAARRVSPPPTPVPFAPSLEEAWLPSVGRIDEALSALLGTRR